MKFFKMINSVILISTCFINFAYADESLHRENSSILKNYQECKVPATQLPPAPGEIDPESQCGNSNDWQDVELYDGTLGPDINFVLNHEGPVGQIQWNNNINSIYTEPGNVNNARWCSGTLIADNLFLTAGHCFDVQPNDGNSWDFPIDAATGNEITPAQAARNMHVNFDYQLDSYGNLRTATQAAIVELSEHRLGGKDYAIVQIAFDAGQTFGITNVSDNIPALNDQLTIIQHPSGIPKVIEAGDYDGVETSGGLTGYMRYTDLDTAGGSSGSGILDDSGDLIGVHTNAGCTISGGANHGVLIDDIADGSTIIQDILSGSPICYSSSTKPSLSFKGTENYTVGGKQFVRYKLEVKNWASFTNDLFAPAPYLPACGLNPNSSRTWVEIYDQNNKRLYGFCAFNSNDDLTKIWFAVEKGQTAPMSVYIILHDRQCEIEYKSNSVRFLTIAPRPPVLVIKDQLIKVDGPLYLK